MGSGYVVDDLAEFVVGARPSDLSPRSRALLKRNVLDSVACAIGALGGELIGTIREHTEQFSGTTSATLVGGGRASVDQAAFFNTVLVRYPDLLDTYLTVGAFAIPPTTSVRSWPWPSTPAPTEPISCSPSRSPMRSNVGSVQRFP